MRPVQAYWIFSTRNCKPCFLAYASTASLLTWKWLAISWRVTHLAGSLFLPFGAIPSRAWCKRLASLLMSRFIFSVTIYSDQTARPNSFLPDVRAILSNHCRRCSRKQSRDRVGWLLISSSCKPYRQCDKGNLLNKLHRLRASAN